jgi:hypothetical protein
LLYEGGIIEYPYLEGDTLDITSCPVHDDYRLRHDIVSGIRGTHSLRKEIGVTDYDDPNVSPVDPAVLHPHPGFTPRIILTLGDL